MEKSKIYKCRHNKNQGWEDVDAFSPECAAEEYAESNGLEHGVTIHVKNHGKYFISVEEEYHADKKSRY